jgi:hypothetical protein
MYKNFHIINRRLNPAIRNMLDNNKQKYAKNRLVIKRRLSYANIPPPDPNWPYYLLVLCPVVLNIYNNLKK